MTGRQLRQYVGIALVAIAYLGGIFFWTQAATQMEPKSPPAAPDTLNTPSGALGPEPAERLGTGFTHS